MLGNIILVIILIIVILTVAMVIRTQAVEKKEAVYTPSEDKERMEAYAKKLGRMVQYETVSYMDKPDAEKFRGFHKVLGELFPNVFENLEKIEIDGNLMMKWKGMDSSLNPIVLLSHQDVVPAEGDWTNDPFSGEIVDGKIYGRGTVDIKNGAFAFYQAVEELITEGYRPKCDVYLGSSCTEEISGDGAPKMRDWFMDHGIRLHMLCDEGGYIVKNPVAGVKGSVAAIGIFEKGYGDMKFIARSRGGHASMPPKNTPIMRLAKFEAAIEKRNPFRAKFSPAVDAMFKNLVPYTSSFSLKLIMANLGILKPLMKILLPEISMEVAAMLKTTIAFTMQKGSDGCNVLPQEAWVIGNLRYIPHQGMDESNRIITKLAAKYDIETELLNANDYSESLDMNGPQFDMIRRCIGKVFPGVGIMPLVLTGGTDARSFDPVCDACVRFMPFAIDADQMGRIHGVDENININVLPGAVDYFKEMIRMQEER